MADHLGPGQLCDLCGAVRAAVVDDYDAVSVLFSAQDDRAYTYLFVVCGEDGGNGGQVGTSGKWVRWIWVGYSS